MGHPLLYIKPVLYECRDVQTSKIFKQNQIILIHSGLIAFLALNKKLMSYNLSPLSFSHDTKSTVKLQ